MLVTIITDASHCNDTGAAGYGYWVVCDRGRESGGGVITARVADSTQAEMMAVCNGLWIGLNCGMVRPGDSVLLQTDCLSAVQIFQGQGKTPKDALLRIKQYILDLACKHDLRLRFRWVPGHTRGETSRTHVNNICDEYAKKYMRRQRTHFRLMDVKALITKGDANGRRAASCPDATQ